MQTVRPTHMLAVVVFVLSGPAAHIYADPIQALTEVRRHPSTRTVTEEDNGARIALQVGDRLLIKLGGDWDWTMDPFDTAILKPVTGALPKGALALLEARKTGETKLSITGDPPCAKSRPPCNAPSRRFQVTIVVH